MNGTQAQRAAGWLAAFPAAVLLTAAGDAAAGAPLAPEGDLARVRSAQLPKSFSADAAAVGDLNGDGKDDVVVSGVLRTDASERALFQFLTGADGELGSAERFDLKLDVTSWALADVHPDPGEECVLFAARGAFVMRRTAEESERFALLAEADFLWQLPDDEGAFLYESAVIDLDGDGLDDLLLPEPEGYALFYQRRSKDGARFEPAGRLRVPFQPAQVGAYVSAAGGQAGWRGQRSDTQLGLSRSVSAGVDDDYALPSTMLTVNERVPAPQVIDWNGDGRVDLLVQTASRLYVWPQGAAGFSDAERRSFALPVEADRDRRLDASYSSHAVELNGDNRSDCVIFAGDNQKKEIRTQALIFTQGAGRGSSAQTPEAPLFGPRGRPQDLLVFAGFVVEPDFQDVDGDGKLDLVILGVRPDLIDQLRSISSESIEADLFVYLNQGGRFSRRPDLSYTLDVPLEQFERTARFIGDLTGDGTSELLLRDDPEQLQLLMVRRPRGEGELTLIDRPLWELSVHKRAVIQRQLMPGRALPDLLVIERTQVLHVRLGGRGQ